MRHAWHGVKFGKTLKIARKGIEKRRGQQRLDNQKRTVVVERERVDRQVLAKRSGERREVCHLVCSNWLPNTGKRSEFQEMSRKEVSGGCQQKKMSRKTWVKRRMRQDKSLTLQGLSGDWCQVKEYKRKR